MISNALSLCFPFSNSNSLTYNHLFSFIWVYAQENALDSNWICHPLQYTPYNLSNHLKYLIKHAFEVNRLKICYRYVRPLLTRTTYLSAEMLSGMFNLLLIVTKAIKLFLKYNRRIQSNNCVCSVAYKRFYTYIYMHSQIYI